MSSDTTPTGTILDEKRDSRDVTDVRATLKDGIPHYLGLTGDRLLTAVTLTATLGSYLPY